MAFDIPELLSIVGLSSILSILLSGFVSWLSREREFKREQNIAYLKERLDNFYSPMVFHFENMRSWAAAHGHKSGYVFATGTLGDKLEDMKGLMRSGMRLVSPKVEELWYAWQLFAVAAVERRRGQDFYPKFSDEEFQNRSAALHVALKEDRERLHQIIHQALLEPFEPVFVVCVALMAGPTEFELRWKPLLKFSVRSVMAN